MTPKGHWINETKGIVPDYDVSNDNSEEDSQLEKIIELINNEEK